MSRSIIWTQGAPDGSVVHVLVNTGEVTQAVSNEDGLPVFEGAEGERQPVMVPVTETVVFGPMPEFTDASLKTRFDLKTYMAQCEREVQALIDAENVVPEMVTL